MAKQRLDQLYCTHCTYRTSALHRRDGASGDQVFDESARASSVPREKCHDVFRSFSSYLLYHVPGDMSAAEMVKHTVHTLPFKRLIYVPSVGGNRLLAQVCFRPADASGRPGASFSHVLIQDLRDNPIPWSPLECLRLWGSKKWVIEDRVNLPQDLPSFGDLKEFDPGYPSLINDQVLLSFLKAPVGTEFHDRGVIIPKRWEKITPDERQKVLVYLLQAVLNLSFERRDSIFLVAEPSVVALLFYGVFRLMPAGGLADTLSFSTYQSHRDRLSTALAGTCFHDPSTVDLPEEWYTLQARGAAYNTFKINRQTPLRKTSPLAGEMVAKFLAPGPAAVAYLPQKFNQLGTAKVEESDGLSTINGLIAALLQPQSKEQLANLERGVPQAVGLRAFFREKLAASIGFDYESSFWARSFEQPGQGILILKLLTENDSSESSSAIQAIVQAMIARWPETAATELLNERIVPKKSKIDFVYRCVDSKLTLPGDAVSLFFTAGAVCQRDKLLEEVLARLPGPKLKPFVLKSLSLCPTEFCFCELLRSLAPLSNNADHDQAFEQLFQQVAVRATRADQKKQFLDAALTDRVIRSKLKTWMYSDALAAHLFDVLNSLEKSPRQLEQRLALLEDLKGFITDSQIRISAWRTVATQLQILQKLNSEPVGTLQWILGLNHQTEREQAARDLAFAAKNALPVAAPEEIDGFVSAVTRLASETLGEEGLPKQFRERVKDVFVKNTWVVRRSRGRAVVGLIATAVSIGLLAIFGFGLLAPSRPGDRNQASISDDVAVDTLNDQDFAAKKLAAAELAGKKIRAAKLADEKQAAEKQAAEEQEEQAKAEREKVEVAEKEAAKAQVEADKRKAAKAEAARREFAQAEVAKREAEKQKQAGKMPADENPPQKPDKMGPPAVVGPPGVKTPAEPSPPMKKVTMAPPGPPVNPPATPVDPPDVSTTEWPSQYVLPDVTNMGPKDPIRLRPWPGTKETRLTLVGISELNTYFAKPTSGALKTIRLLVEHRKPTDDEAVPAVRVFKIPTLEYELRKSGVAQVVPNDRDLICQFTVQPGGLYFQWGNQGELTSETRLLQEMIRMCCLHVEQQGLQRDINLIASQAVPSDEMYRGLGRVAEQASVALFTDDPITKRRVFFDFDPKLKGAEAFEWLVTRGRVVSSDNPNSGEFKLTPDAAVKAKPNRGFAIPMTDQELIKKWRQHKFSCDTVQFNQIIQNVNNAAQESHVRLVINVVLDLIEERIKERAKSLDDLQQLPIEVANLQDQISKFDGDPFTNDNKNIKLFDSVTRIEKMAAEMEAWYDGDPEAKPMKKRKLLDEYEIKITMKTTLATVDLDKLKIYLKDILAYCGRGNRSRGGMNEQLKFAKNKDGEFDLAALSRMKQFQKLEVYELSRRVDGRWIPVIFKAER